LLFIYPSSSPELPIHATLRRNKCAMSECLSRDLSNKTSAVWNHLIANRAIPSNTAPKVNAWPAGCNRNNGGELQTISITSVLYLGVMMFPSRQSERNSLSGVECYRTTSIQRLLNIIATYLWESIRKSKDNSALPLHKFSPAIDQQLSTTWPLSLPVYIEPFRPLVWRAVWQVTAICCLPPQLIIHVP